MAGTVLVAAIVVGLMMSLESVRPLWCRTFHGGLFLEPRPSTLGTGLRCERCGAVFADRQEAGLVEDWGRRPLGREFRAPLPSKDPNEFRAIAWRVMSGGRVVSCRRFLMNGVPGRKISSQEWADIDRRAYASGKGMVIGHAKRDHEVVAFKKDR